jgi:hypothetical protein
MRVGYASKEELYLVEHPFFHLVHLVIHLFFFKTYLDLKVAS